MTTNERLAAMQAELDALNATRPSAPAVFATPATAEQQETASRKPQPRSARRGSSPVKTR